MEWSELYRQENQPTLSNVSDYINNSLWAEINQYLQNTYHVQPKLAYSKCSGQPGWNIKYQKSGKSLCTLYPMPGCFIALVVIGEKETPKVEMLMPVCSDYIQALYQKTTFSCGGRWLMVYVTDAEILKNVQNLIAIRVIPK